MKKLLLLLTIFTTLHVVEAEEKYQLAVCAAFKNEALDLEEWIDYHHNIGVEHFYLYNKGSEDAYRSTLASYIEKNLVTLVNWPNVDSYPLPKNVSLYENAIHVLAKDEAEWLVLMDTNEFLVFEDGDATELLRKHENNPAVSFNFLDADKKISKKMIFKPDLCVGFSWPPYQCRFKDDVSAVELDRHEVQLKRFVKNANRKVLSYELSYKPQQESMYSRTPREIA